MLSALFSFRQARGAFFGQYWKALFCCLFLALSVRVVVACFLPGAWRPDEFFQYMEPAHRLTYGTGIVTWEWRVGIRSWLVPGFLAALMKGGQALGVQDQLLFMRTCMALLSLPIVIAFFWYGWRKGGAFCAWVLGLFAILWPDLVNGGIRTLGEFLGGNTLGVGVILTLAYRNEVAHKKAVLIVCLAGLAFGLTAAIRFQLAPVACLAMIFLWKKGKTPAFASAIAAFLGPIFLLGWVDYETLGHAFQSVFKNYYYNKTLGVADTYGKKWIGYYIQEYIMWWGALFVAAVFFVSKAKAEKKIPLILASFVVLYHSLIAHKEVSFIYAASVLVAFVAACGCYESIQKYQKQKAIILSGISAAMVCTFASTYAPFLAADSISLKFQRLADKQPDVCGIALLTSEKGKTAFDIGGGYSTLFKQVPLYLYSKTQEAIENKNQYNYIITSERGVEPIFLKEWEIMECKKEKLCLYHRVGSLCAGKPDFEQFSNKLKELNK